MTQPSDPDAAKARARAARGRFLATLDRTKAKLNPSTIAEEAVERVAGPAILTALTTAVKVRRHPRLALGTFIIVAGAVLAVPVMRVARRLDATRRRQGN